MKDGQYYSEGTESYTFFGNHYNIGHGCKCIYSCPYCKWTYGSIFESVYFIRHLLGLAVVVAQFFLDNFHQLSQYELFLIFFERGV